MLPDILTGVALGLGIVYVVSQFGLDMTTYRKWIDLLMVGILIFLVIEVKTNFVVGLTTWASVTISLSLRLMQWFQNRKTA